MLVLLFSFVYSMILLHDAQIAVYESVVLLSPSFPFECYYALSN
jgi:hypothetical protein